jgi:O-methyltransferase involved in polyketide biosynthesis
MGDEQAREPESTAVRVALWRALHVEIDPPPHVLEDEIGLQMVAPGDGWRARPDMDPDGTRGFRASIVARARFIEDLVAEQAGRGVSQYVLLGLVWTPSRSGARRSRPGCGSLRSTSRARKPGSASG